MNTEITIPDLHAYAAMDITALWDAALRLAAQSANGQIDAATYDQRSQVVKLALQIRADEWEISAAQQRLAENRQRLVALVPPLLSAEALFVLRFIADRESKDNPEFLMGFSSHQRQTIEGQLITPGYVEVVEGPWDPDMDRFGKFYIVTPAGLAFFKDK